MKNILKSLSFLLLFLLLISCNQKTEILKLNKHSGKGIYDRGEDSTKVFYYQSALVSNVPNNQDQIELILFEFHKKNIDSIFSNKEVVDFSTNFYLKNNKTSYFTDNEDDPGGFSSEILSDYFEKYGIAEIRSSRKMNSKTIKHEIVFANSNKKVIPIN